MYVLYICFICLYYMYIYYIYIYIIFSNVVVDDRLWDRMHEALRFACRDCRMFYVCGLRHVIHQPCFAFSAFVHVGYEPTDASRQYLRRQRASESSSSQRARHEVHETVQQKMEPRDSKAACGTSVSKIDGRPSRDLHQPCFAFWCWCLRSLATL